MGNKPTKEGEEEVVPPSPQLPTKETTKIDAEGPPSPDKSPVVSAYDPMREEDVEENVQIDPTDASKTETPTKEESSDPPTELSPTENPEVTMPPLALEKIDQTPPVVEDEEEDPDLMRPPPFLTDAIGPLNDGGHPIEERRSGNVDPDPETAEQLLLASPVLHDAVSLDPPTPLRQGDEAPPERDDISIDDEVAAADSCPPALGPRDEGTTTEPPTFVTSSCETRSMLHHVPEETVPLVSKFTRGEDDLMMKIMGTSVLLPDATSNESFRGSYAYSELTIDGMPWELARGRDTPVRVANDASATVNILIKVRSDNTVAMHFIYNDSFDDPSPSGADETSEIVKSMIDSVFSKVVLDKNDMPPSGDIYQDTMEESNEGKVTVHMDEVNGEIKIALATDRQEKDTIPQSVIHKVSSTVSSQQDSIELKTPFTNIYSSDDPASSISEEHGRTATETASTSSSMDQTRMKSHSLKTETISEHNHGEE